MRDSSRVKFDLEARSEKLDKILGTIQIKGDRGSIGFDERVVPIPPARVREPHRNTRNGPRVDHFPYHHYTCTFCGCKGYLKKNSMTLGMLLGSLGIKSCQFPTPLPVMLHLLGLGNRI